MAVRGIGRWRMERRAAGSGDASCGFCVTKCGDSAGICVCVKGESAGCIVRAYGALAGEGLYV